MSRRQRRAWLRERDRALLALDLDWARNHLRSRGLPQPQAAQSARTGRWISADEVLLLALHRARYELPYLPEAARKESEAWMRERGFRRYGELPWPGEEH